MKFLGYKICSWTFAFKICFPIVSHQYMNWSLLSWTVIMWQCHWRLMERSTLMFRKKTVFSFLWKCECWSENKILNIIKYWSKNNILKHSINKHKLHIRLFMVSQEILKYILTFSEYTHIYLEIAMWKHVSISYREKEYHLVLHDNYISKLPIEWISISGNLSKL